MIQNSHCSRYFRDSIHIATMLSEVVKASPSGTGLSVKLRRIRNRSIHSPMETSSNGSHSRLGVWQMVNSSLPESLLTPLCLREAVHFSKP